MTIPRTRGISTKVTNQEYATLERAASGRTLSQWAREVLLRAAISDPAEAVILAELLALRAILLNLHFALAVGQTPTADTLQRLIERADSEKIRRAYERLVSSQTRAE